MPILMLLPKEVFFICLFVCLLNLIYTEEYITPLVNRFANIHVHTHKVAAVPDNLPICRISENHQIISYS